MQFRIDYGSGRPVYQQIIDQVKRDIALGRLEKGEKLPTVRQLAAQIAINPNTIVKAYRQLEREGIIITKAGSGAFVSSIDTNLTISVRKKIIHKELERTIVEAIHMQITKDTLSQWFKDCLEKFRFANRKG
ncbi:MAG: GntR family transcriptional regulator [Sedimentisphaerales bacterium]|nr:GntR family transcriptional regulator [Sedimentisphaerales bacterium]